MGALTGFRSAFDWEGDRRPHHDSDAIIYELHVKGFTKHPNSGVDPSRAGTYAGLVEKIPYLKDLGITIVELMPIFQRDPQEGDFWGYMLVAEGAAEIVCEPEVSLWDLAAPRAIVEEAGGRFTDLAGVATAAGGDALATNGLVHDEALAIIGRVGA